MSLVAANGVITLQADKTKPSPEIDGFLRELGNADAIIPYLAIFPADGRDPITLLGKISQEQVLAELKKAGPSKKAPTSSSTAAR